MVSHDFDVPYIEHDLGAVVATFTQQASDDGRGIVVRGTCPKCLGESVTEYRWGVPGSGTKGIFVRRADDADVLRSEVLYCECGYLHPNQPASPVFLGCGASWRVLPEEVL